MSGSARTRRRRRPLPLAGFLALFLMLGALPGCDAVEAPEVETLGPGGADSKLRHGHLLERAARPAAFVRAELAALRGEQAVSMAFSSAGADSSGYVGLIIGLDTYKVLSRYGKVDPYKVLSRYSDPEKYKVLSRYSEVDPYKVLSRYEYDEVFDGMAIWASEEIVALLIADMSADDEIAWIEPDIEVEVHPFGLREAAPTGTESVSWGAVVSGQSTAQHDLVDLFVVDTGVSTTDVSLGSAYDFTTSTSGQAPDVDGHGTHVAGIAAGLANGRGVRGVAPGAKVHALRVLTGLETDDGTPVDLSKTIAAVERVVAHKLAHPRRPVVLNLSLGAEVGTTAYNALDEAVVAATQNGVTVVVAAGNSGIDASTVTPAHVEEAIVVGAYDTLDRMPSFSNYGASVDLLAPGVDILSLDHDADGVVLMSGTSTAAPFVAGAAVAYLATQQNATPQQVEAMLIETARPGILGTPEGTTDRALDLMALTGGYDLPWLSRYALAAKQDITVSHDLTIASRTGGNANVYTSGRLHVDEGTQTKIEGFGYHASGFTGDAGAFQPRYNPSNLPVVMQQEPLALPAFRAQDFQQFATQTSSGSVWITDEQVHLGTADEPGIWYISDRLWLSGATLTGYGVILLGDDLIVRNGSSIVSALDGTATIAIYSENDVRLYGGNIEAHILAKDELTLDSRVRVEGGLAALGSVEVRSDAQITYAPLATELLRALRHGD